MSTDLGTGVFNLMADPERLVRGEDKALANTLDMYRRMERRGDEYVTHQGQMAQMLQRVYFGPIEAGFARAAAAADLLQAASERATGAIIADSALQVRAINAVTDAYQRLALAAGLAHGAGSLGTGGGVFRAEALAPPGGAQRFFGARGDQGIGSVRNPWVVAIESGSLAGLASYAADVAAKSLGAGAAPPTTVPAISDTSRMPTGGQGFVMPRDMTMRLESGQYAGLIAALSSDAASDTKLLTGGAGGGEGGGVPPAAIGPGDQQMLLGMSRIAGLLESSAQAGRTSIAAGPTQVDWTRLYPAFRAVADQTQQLSIENQRIAGLLEQTAQARTLNVDQPLTIEMARIAGLLEASTQANRPIHQMPGPAPQTVYEMPPVERQLSPAEVMTIIRSLWQEQSMQSMSRGRQLGAGSSNPTDYGPFRAAGDWVILEKDIQANTEALNANTAAGGKPPSPPPPPRSTGGGDAPPPGDGGGMGLGALLGAFLHGQGGGGGMRIPFTRIGLPAAGAGTLGMFAGLGAERYATTALSLAGSAGAGLAGAGVLGLGAAGQLAVGGGADLAVMKSTISDTKTLSQNYQQLQQAIQVYGANSRQAAVAQQQLNYQMTQLGPAAGAEMGLAKAVDQLNQLWDKTSANARLQAVNILNQVVNLGTQYVPRVSAAAQKNLAIINEGLKPLFAWLEGPQGIGIFNTLENNFAHTLPYSVDAFNNAMELLLKVMGDASGYTGQFMIHLDGFLKRLNSQPPQKIADFVGRLIGDFRLWENLMIEVGRVLRDIFRNDAGLGAGIVATLTGMLAKLDEWLKTTQGRTQLHNIFELHKQEVLALLQILPGLVKGFGAFYLTVSPALISAMTGVLTVFAQGLNILADIGHQLPIVGTALGIFLVSWRTFGLKSTWGVIKDGLGAMAGGLGVTGIRAQEAAAKLGLLTDAELANMNQARATAAANAELDASMLGGGAKVPGRTASAAQSVESAGAAEAQSAESGVIGGLRQGFMSSAVKGLTVGLLGTMITEGVASGFHGGTKKAISSIGTDASIGAGIGGIFGPEGMIGGALIGGLIGSMGLWVNHDVANEGKNFANKFTASLPSHISDATRKGLADATAKAIANQSPAQATKLAPHAPALPGEGWNPAEFQVQFQKAFQAMYNSAFTAGKKAGQAWIQGMAGVKFPTEIALFADMRQRLLDVPKGLHGQAATIWRNEAASQMIAYAQSLAAKGQLPVKQVDDLIRKLEAQFPGLKDYLQKSTGDTAKAIAANLKLTDAQKNWTNALLDFRTQWDFTEGNQKITAGNIVTNTSLAMGFLKDVMAHGSRDQRLAAEKEYDLLQRHTADYFSKMLSDTTTKIDDMKGQIQHGSHDAQQKAGDSFGYLAGQVEAAMKAGVISTQTGNQLINKALQKTLSAFGSKQVIPAAVDITVGTITAGVDQFRGNVKSLFGLGGQTGGFIPTGAQTGALYQIGQPGQRGQDTVGLNVGGMPIAVAPGEKVAVFNAPQQEVMDRALAGEGYGGGLDQMFSAINVPHAQSAGRHYQRGGMTGHQAGGYVFPFGSGAAWGRVDQGVDFSGSGPIGAIGPATVTYSNANDGWYPPRPAFMVYQLSAGPDAGKYIYVAEGISNMAPAGTQVQAGQAIAEMIDGIEMGWAAGPHGYQIQAASNASHLTQAGQDFDNFLTGLKHGVITGGAFGGGAPTIPTPKVGGSGTIREIVQRAMTLEANAANQWLARQTSLGSIIGTGPGGVGGLNGSVEQQMAQAGGQLGYNKIAIAGLIGNAMQESSLNASANSPGTVGLFSWDQSGNPTGTAPVYAILGNVGAQMALATQQAGGAAAVAAMNAQSSPEAAALWWSNNFEHDSIYGNRGTYAAQAYAAGYELGGPVATEQGLYQPKVLGGGPSKTGRPPHHQRSPAQRGHRPARLPKGSKRTTTGAKTNRNSRAEKFTKLPRLKPLPGMDQGLINKVTNLTGRMTELGQWQGYIQSLHAQKPVVPVVTLADGSEVINRDGMIDPTTGQWVYGINTRLEQIGDPGRNPNATATRNINTELGIDETLLDDMLKQKRFVGELLGGGPDQKGPGFVPWLTRERGKYVTANMEIHALTHLERWLREEKAKLPQERTDAAAALTRKFSDARYRIQVDSSHSSFDASKLLHHQLAGVTEWETSALHQVPVHAPAYMLGDTSGWFLAQNIKRGQITNQAQAWREAVQQAGRQQVLRGRLSRLGAMHGLSLTESQARQALGDEFDTQGRDIQYDLPLTARNVGGAHRLAKLLKLGFKRGEPVDLTSDATIIKADKKDLSTIEQALTAAVGSKNGGYVAGTSNWVDTLDQYGYALNINNRSGIIHGYKWDPMSTGAINIDTKRNIDIPTLLNEISTLTHTKLPTATSPNAQDLAGVLSQLNQQMSEAFAVSQRQYAVLASLPPFAGAFEHGGIVPGPAGEPRLIIGHGGEEYMGVGQRSRTEVHIYGAIGALVDTVCQVVDGKKQELSDFVNHDLSSGARARRLLPTGASAGSLGRAYGRLAG